MAPRAPETQANVILRLRHAASSGGPIQIRFGGAHHTHAIVREGEAWRIRRLVADPARIEAFRARHHRFMPEDAERLSEPGEPVLVEAASMEELISQFQKLPWPFTG